jgi:hypothetical protein
MPPLTVSDELRRLADAIQEGLAIETEHAIDMALNDEPRPQAPATRDLPTVIQALKVVNEEFGHHVVRLRRLTPQAATDENMRKMLELLGGMEIASRYVRMLRKHLEGRLDLPVTE